MTVLDWLLDSDPAIRWQLLRDLVHAPSDVVAAERAQWQPRAGVPGCWRCTLRVLRYRVLDWFCITPHRCGSLDSMGSTGGIQNIFVIPEKGNLPWRCLIT